MQDIHGTTFTISWYVASLVSSCGTIGSNLTGEKIGGAVIEFVFTVTCFWDSDGASFQESRKQESGASPDTGGLRKILFTMPSARVTWICAIFLLGYVGIEVAVGGWIVSFMKEVRHAAPFDASMTSTGFWLGIATGRIVLGFVTPMIGEKVAISVSLIFSHFQCKLKN